MSWMEDCKGALCRSPHIVPQPSPETNAPKTLKPHRAERIKNTKKFISQEIFLYTVNI